MIDAIYFIHGPFISKKMVLDVTNVCQLAKTDITLPQHIVLSTHWLHYDAPSDYCMIVSGGDLFPH